jgi:soluble lytic murein transglycosylase
VLERVGDAHLAAGRVEEALASYAAALEEAPDAERSRVLLWAMARLYFQRDDTDQALAQYETLLTLARTATQRAEIELRQAEVLLAAGRIEDAEIHLRAAASAAPTTSYAYEALRMLLDMDATVDEFLRGKIDYHNGAYLPALEAFQRYIADDPTGYDPQAHDYVARSYLALHLPDLAEAEWDQLILRFPESRLWGEAWLSQAKALRNNDRLDYAQTLLRHFAAEHPEQQLAPEALALVAQWEERAGRYAEAAEEYAALQQRYPDSGLAAGALHRAALNRYRLGEYDEAVALWRELLEGYSSFHPQASRFWLGRALLAAGEPSAAAGVWQALLDLAPEGYYAGRAGTLAAQAGLGLSSTLAEAPLDGGGQAAAEEWLRGWLPVDAAADVSVLPGAVLQDRAFQRGQALLALGLRREALTYLEQVKDGWLDDQQAMYALALHFRDLGAYRLSILCAARLLDLSPLAQRAAAPRYLQELAYPTYYADLVQQEAAAQGLDATLLYAIIRQESLFEPTALSHAGAQGLMQVIPATGEWVAQQIGWTGYQASQLELPYVSVKFGVQYLSFTLGYGGDDLMTGLVGYNAGPGNARYWREFSGDDGDLFAEGITNSEAQRYVQGVLQQHEVYQRLYSPANR